MSHHQIPRKQGPEANALHRQGTALEEGEHLPSCGKTPTTFSVTSPTGHPALKWGLNAKPQGHNQNCRQAQCDDPFSFTANHCSALLCPLTRSKALAGQHFYYYSTRPRCQKPWVTLPDWASQRLRMGKSLWRQSKYFRCLWSQRHILLSSLHRIRPETASEQLQRCNSASGFGRKQNPEEE